VYNHPRRVSQTLTTSTTPDSVNNNGEHCNLYSVVALMTAHQSAVVLPYPSRPKHCPDAFYLYVLTISASSIPEQKETVQLLERNI
jgi:hypothetical protein